MNKVREALQQLEGIEDRTERAFEVAGLISTLFKIRGVILIVTGEMAFSSYANVSAKYSELELAPLVGRLTPRLVQEIMSGLLEAEGAIGRWTLVEVPVLFHNMFDFALRDLCRDFKSDHGSVKLLPAEEITAERILASVFPIANPIAHREALMLLSNALCNAFQMDWHALHRLCHHPDYLVGEELAQLRAKAKREADRDGLTPDEVGEASDAA